ncbi:MAG: SCP2 sterol-binding domain-containing protein [Thermoleophilia bacterium]
MADVVEGFFQTLAARGHEPVLHLVSGTFRFEIGKRRWLVCVQKGDVRVSREEAAADCVLVCDRPMFAAFLAGEKNAVTAGMRGDLLCEGDVGLGMLFQRLFPGPNDRVDGGVPEQLPA